ncbi:MAG: hypothetical protein IKG42_02790 [Clostridia bacterium]|nr:hypothetical protein [Clostridia bacterium]
MKKKKIRFLILMIIIINLIFMMLLAFVLQMSRNSNNEEKESNNNSDTLVYKTVDLEKEVNNEFKNDKKIVPEGFTFLVRFYEGNLDDDYVFEKIYSFIYEFIPTLQEKTKNLTNEEIIKYYNDNSKEIINITGIEDKNDFLELVKSLGDNNTIENYNKCVFDTESFDSDEYYSKCKLDIIYNDEVLHFLIYLANNKDITQPNIKIIPIQ